MKKEEEAAMIRTFLAMTMAQGYSELDRALGEPTKHAFIEKLGELIAALAGLYAELQGGAGIMITIERRASASDAQIHNAETKPDSSLN